jgi:hypothetical protein
MCLQTVVRAVVRAMKFETQYRYELSHRPFARPAAHPPVCFFKKHIVVVVVMRVRKPVALKFNRGGLLITANQKFDRYKLLLACY